MLKVPLKVAARAIRVLSASVLLRLANRSDALGLMLVDLTVDQKAGYLFETVEAALLRIRDVDPVRYKRISRDVSRVAVIQSPGSAGEFWREYDAIALEMEHLRQARLDAICMTIVHEATHARIYRWGVRKTIAPARVEHACVKQEIVFAKRIPGNEMLVNGALMKLETKWWLDTSSSQRYAQRLATAGAPPWLRKLLVWIHR